MPQGNPKPGELYLHFKKKLYQIITVAEHSETQEPLVVYQALYGSFKTYARPLAMFLSPVDTEKYPDAAQEYRFQLVAPDGASGESGEAAEAVQAAQPQEGGMPFANTECGMEIPPGRKSATELSPEEKLMAFFDAETMDEKYHLLLEMGNDITDRMVNNMAVALDVVIDEGPLDQRYEELKTCVRTFRRYETHRLR